MYAWGNEIERDIITETVNGLSIPTYESRPVNLPNTLQTSALLHPERVALVCGDTRITYEDFYRRVLTIATYLHDECNFQRGERIAIILKNTAEFCIMTYAALFAGLIVVPISTKLRPNEMAVLLNDAKVNGIVIDSDEQAQALSALLIIKARFFYQSSVMSNFGVEYQDFSPLPQLSTHDPAFIMYTSGTTGNPKGVVLSHFNAIHGAINYERCYGLTSADKTIIAVPIFHGTGLMAQLVTFVYLGGTIVLLETFNAHQMLELSEKEQITHTICVPTIYNLLMQVPNYSNYNLTYRVLGTGGAPISQKLFQNIKNWLPNAELLNTYGLTEATSPALMTPKEMARHKIGSIGIASPVIECRIIDIDEGGPVKTGQPGEILLKGALITSGYWNNETATRETIVDGWLHTGDVGWMDDDGFVYLCDRIKNMINRGGEKIYSIEVEDVISSHPEVLEVAAVGVADELYGEVVKAVVIPVHGNTLKAEDIISWASERLAKFKVPRFVEFRDSLPRNAAGKVVKSSLRE